MWFSKGFTRADYRRTAAAIIDSLGLLRGVTGSYPRGVAVPDPDDSGFFQHRPDTIIYPVLVKMAGTFATIVFTAPWTCAQVEHVFQALTHLLLPTYRNVVLSTDGMSIQVGVTCGTHAVDRLDAGSTAS